jgi:hypothetical protein
MSSSRLVTVIVVVETAWVQVIRSPTPARTPPAHPPGTIKLHRVRFEDGSGDKRVVGRRVRFPQDADHVG